MIIRGERVKKYIYCVATNEYISLTGTKTSLANIWTTLNFTISFWWKPVGSNNGILKPLMGNNSGNAFGGVGFWLYQATNGTLSFYVSNSGRLILNSSAITTDDWHHIAITCNTGGTDRNIYVNAAPQGAGVYAGAQTGTAALDVRVNQYGVSNSKANRYDKISFFNRGINQTEVTELFNKGREESDYSTLSFSDALIDIYECDEVPLLPKLSVLGTGVGVNMDSSNVIYESGGYVAGSNGLVLKEVGSYIKGSNGLIIK